MRVQKEPYPWCPWDSEMVLGRPSGTLTYLFGTHPQYATDDGHGVAQTPLATDSHDGFL